MSSKKSTSAWEQQPRSLRNFESTGTTSAQSSAAARMRRCICRHLTSLAFTARSFGPTTTVGSPHGLSFRSAKSSPPARTTTGFSAGMPLWAGAALSVDASQRKVRGQVNGNVLVPTLAERIPRTNDPATRAVIESIFNAYPAEAPNRPDIDPRALNTNSPQSINHDRASALLDQSWGANDRLSLRYSVTLAGCRGLSARRRSKPRHDDEEPLRSHDLEPCLDAVDSNRLLRWF